MLSFPQPILRSRQSEPPRLVPLGVVGAVQTSSENTEESIELLRTQPSSHAIKGACSSPGPRQLNPGSGCPKRCALAPEGTPGERSRNDTLPRLRPQELGQCTPGSQSHGKFPGGHRGAEEIPTPLPPHPASVQVPRSHIADPAAPRSILLAPTAYEAPYGRISLSLFPAGGVAAAVALARRRPQYSPAPSLPLRSQSCCWILGCRRCHRRDSGRRPAHRRRRRRRPPHRRQSPPTCPPRARA